MTTTADPPERQCYIATKSNNAAWLRGLLGSNQNLFGSERKEAIQSLLKYAVESDADEIIDVIVEFGGEVNKPINSSDPEGIIEETALGGQCKRKAAKRLLELGAEINFDTSSGKRCRVLSFAISKGDLEMVKLLLQHGAVYDSIYAGMTALDHALSLGQTEIAEYLRSVGGKTAMELGWIPPPPAPESQLSEILAAYFDDEHIGKIGTIHGMLDLEPVIDVHVFDEGVQIVLHTEGMASRPIPTDPGEEQYRFVEIEMILPQAWPTGDDMLKTDESAWPVQWLRRLALHPHYSKQPIGTLFFYPNASPPKPFATNTDMCYWMLMLSHHDTIYVSDAKQIVIYSAVPLYREEYELIQRSGVGALAKRFDENKIHPHQMFVRKNVAI